MAGRAQGFGWLSSFDWALFADPLCVWEHRVQEPGLAWGRTHPDSGWQVSFAGATRGGPSPLRGAACPPPLLQRIWRLG